MTSRSQRRIQMKNAHITAIVVGILLVLAGFYFIFVIRGQTNDKIAKCTETTTGTVSAVSYKDSRYLTTIDYEIDGSFQQVTFKTKKEIAKGTPVEVRYEPLSYKHVYVEGMSETGTTNVITGLIMIAMGVIFAAMGFAMKKKKNEE